MTAFPALVPSSRTFTPGEYPATALAGYTGRSATVRHSNVFIQAQLRLTFKALPEADMLAIWNHYAARRGVFESFTLPTEIVSYSSVSTYVPSTYRWRYASEGSVEDLPCGGHNVSLTLETAPPVASSVAGAQLRMALGLVAGGAAVQVPGAALAIGLSLAAGEATGEAGAGGASLTIGLSLETGGAFTDVEASGADLTVSLSLATGGAFTDVEAAGAALTMSLSLVAGAADGGGIAAYRYWRFDQLTRTGSSGLQVGEFVLVNNGTYVTGGTLYNGGVMNDYPLNWTGTIPAATNGVYNSLAFQIASPASSAYIQYDHGSPVTCTGWKYASYFRPVERYISSVRVQASNDGVTFTTIKTFTLSAYTTDNGTAVNELSPEYSFL